MSSGPWALAVLDGAWRVGGACWPSGLPTEMHQLPYKHTAHRPHTPTWTPGLMCMQTHTPSTSTVGSPSHPEPQTGDWGPWPGDSGTQVGPGGGARSQVQTVPKHVYSVTPGSGGRSRGMAPLAEVRQCRRAAGSGKGPMTLRSKPGRCTWGAAGNLCHGPRDLCLLLSHAWIQQRELCSFEPGTESPGTNRMWPGGTHTGWREDKWPGKHGQCQVVVLTWSRGRGGSGD